MYFNPHNDCLSFRDTQKMMPIHFGTQQNIDAKGHVGNVYAYDTAKRARVQLRPGDLVVILFDALTNPKTGETFNRYLVPTARQKAVYKSMKAKYGKGYTKKFF